MRRWGFAAVISAIHVNYDHCRTPRHLLCGAGGGVRSGNREEDAPPREDPPRPQASDDYAWRRGSTRLIGGARNKLLEGDGMAGATVDAGKGELFCTGSGRPVSVSERAIRRARAFVGEEVEKAGIKRRNLGGVHNTAMPPLFQTGSGKAVLPGRNSIQKARAILEDVDSAAGAVQPMFRTGMGRPVPVNRTFIDKARAVLEGQTAAEQGHSDESVDGMEQFPLFQTGSGRVVSVSSASVQKAKSVLKDNNTSEGRPVTISERSIERSRAAANEGDAEKSGHWDTGCQFPMFQTGLGKPVAASWSSVQKASAVLGEEKTKTTEDKHFFFVFFEIQDTEIAVFVPQLFKVKHQVTRIEKSQEGGNHLPLFQTGLGRSIAISKSSVKRATAVLEPRNIAKELEDEAHLDGGHDTPMFKTGLGRSILASDELCILEAEEAVKSVNNYDGEAFVEEAAFQAGIQKFVPQNRSSSHKASMLLEQRNFTEKGYEDCGGQLPMFRTGSGKSVLISESSMQKAKAVLEEEVKINREQKLGLASGPTENQVHKEPHRPFELSNNTVSDSGEHSIRFSTAGGRSMAISSDALQRARSLLGESDLVVSTNNIVGRPLASACNVEMPNLTVAPKGGPDLSKISRVNGKTELATYSHQTMSDRKHTGSFENAVPAIPATNKQPNMFHVGSRSISEIPKIPKPSSMRLSETDNANDTKDKTQRLHMPAGPLVDISNFMGTHSGNIDHAVNDKRRIEGRNSASSFKRPRSSR
uniref:Uncharacterized protein n=1 Tax=Aegilops tauschii TaxID=37682 RepID=M8CN64_AEGTA